MSFSTSVLASTISFHNLPHADTGQQLSGLCALYIICLGTRRLRYVEPLSDAADAD